MSFGKLRKCSNVEVFVQEPSERGDLATKEYVDSHCRTTTHVLGSTTFQYRRLEEVGDPVEPTDACNKKSVLALIAADRADVATTLATTPVDLGPVGKELQLQLENELAKLESNVASKMEFFKVRTDLERMRARMDDVPIDATAMNVQDRRVTCVGTPVNRSDAATLGTVQDHEVRTRSYVDDTDAQCQERVRHVHKQLEELQERMNAEDPVELLELKHRLHHQTVALSVKEDGLLDVKGRRISGVHNPKEELDAVNLCFLEGYTYSKKYVDAMGSHTDDELARLKRTMQTHVDAVDIRNDGELNVRGRRIAEVGAPHSADDAVNREYLERYAASRHAVHETREALETLRADLPTPVVGDNALNMKHKRLTSLADPVSPTDCVNVNYLEAYAAKKSLVDVTIAKSQEEIACLKRRLALIETPAAASTSLPEDVSVDHRLKRVINVAAPVDPSDVATSQYVKEHIRPITEKLATMSLIVPLVEGLVKEVTEVQNTVTKLTSVQGKSLVQVGQVASAMQDMKQEPRFARSILRIDSVPSVADSPLYRLHTNRCWYVLPYTGTLALYALSHPTNDIVIAIDGVETSFEVAQEVQSGQILTFKYTPTVEGLTTSDAPLRVEFLYAVAIN